MKLGHFLWMVTVLVLFSNAPSFCMEPLDGKEDSKKASRKKRSVISYVIKEQNKSNNDCCNKKKNKINNVIFNKFDNDENYNYDDILQTLLVYCSEDQKTEKAIRIVCPRWNHLLYSAKNIFIKYMLISNRKKDNINELWNMSFFIRVKRDYFPCLDFSAKQDISALSSSPSTISLLGDYYSQLNPFVDFKMVTKASEITKALPDLQGYLWAIIEKEGFYSNQFVELQRDPHNHTRMQKTLMALKILTLSEDKKAIEQMDAFEVVLAYHLSQLTDLGRSYFRYHPEFMFQPFWGAYTVKVGKDEMENYCALREQYRYLRVAMHADLFFLPRNFKPFKLQQIEQFGEYDLIQDPKIHKESQKRFNSVLNKLKNPSISAVIRKLGM